MIPRPISVRLRAWFCALLAVGVLAPAASPAQPALLPGGLGAIPPGLIDQFRSLSPAEQRRLAARYGIDIDSVLGPGQFGEIPALGEPGETLEPAVPYRRRERERLLADEQSLVEEQEGRFRIERLDPGLRFGLDLFDAEVSTFAPVDNAPVPADYRLGPGDSLNVMLIGKENQQFELMLGRDGAVDFPELGKISVAGLRLEEATQLLGARVAAQLIGVEAIIGVGRLRAINVFLAGEVRVPGNRSMSALSRVSHALYASGGLTDIGSLRRITINRGGEEVGQFDAYDLLIRGDASGDLQLQDGDVVFVPPVADMASVSGEVRRPAVYEVEPDTSLGELVHMAGGLTARALRRTAVLERQATDALPKIESVSLDDGSLGTTQIARGDRLRVLSNADRFENRIVLKGAVQRPGVYGYSEGMRVSDLISNVDSDLTENVDYAYALVVSEDLETGRVAVRPFGIREVLAAPGSEDDPMLSPRDQVLFFNNVASAIGESRAREREERLEEEFDLEDGIAGEFDRLASTRGDGDIVDQRAVAFGAAGERYRSSRRTVAEGEVAERGSVDAGRAAGDLADFEDALRRSRAEREREEREALEPNRQRLLAPVIARLEAQASPEDPVRIVSVSGAVHAEGEYPLNPGDTVDDLLAAAGGLRDDAFTREVELQRVLTDSSGAAVVRNMPLDLSSAANEDRDAVLQSRDHLFVRGIPDWRPRDTVTVEGEVRFPGTYLIGPGESLGELLERAGGLTPVAFADGVVFTREALREQEARETRRFISELRNNVAASILTEEGTQVGDLAGLDQLAQSLTQSENFGRLIVDVPRVLAGDSSADVVLQPGDTIRVPAQVNTVTVIGEVQRPGSYRFQDLYAVDDYIATSAGTTRRADSGRMYVLRANGEIRLLKERRLFAFSLADDAVRPGDTIVVPIDTSHRNTLDYWSVIVQIAYQSGIALAAVLAI